MQLLVSESPVDQHGVSFLFWFAKMSCSVTGPVPAITEALKKAGLTLQDMDLVEV